MFMKQLFVFSSSNTIWGRGLIGISGSLFWSKTLMEHIFNPCGKFRWSPEGLVCQIHSPHLHVGAPGIFSDLLRSIQKLKREWDTESNGKLPNLFIPSKTATLVPEFAVEDLPSWALQPRFLRLEWRTCPWAEHPDDYECWVSRSQNFINSFQLLRIKIRFEWTHILNKLPMNHTFKFNQTYDITFGRNRFFNDHFATVSRRQGCGNRPIFHYMWQFS